MLGVSSQGLTGSSCLSSLEDREKAFLSTVDRSGGGRQAKAPESPFCNLAFVFRLLILLGFLVVSNKTTQETISRSEISSKNKFINPASKRK